MKIMKSRMLFWIVSTNGTGLLVVLIYGFPTLWWCKGNTHSVETAQAKLWCPVGVFQFTVLTYNGFIRM